MALATTITKTQEHFTGELVCPEAYCKVGSISGNKDSIFFILNTYNSQGGKVLFNKEYSFAPDLDGPNFIQQAYEYLKTLPEFAAATDC